MLDLHGVIVPDNDQGFGSQLASSTVLARRVDSHAEDVVVVLDYKPLLIRLLVQNDADSSRMIHDLPCGRVPQVAPGVVTAVPVNVLKLEGGIRCLAVAVRRLVLRGDRVLDNACEWLHRHELITGTDLLSLETIELSHAALLL